MGTSRHHRRGRVPRRRSGPPRLGSRHRLADDGTDSVKARNIAAHPDIALHWQVTEQGDGVELWGTAAVHTDVETKRRLWDGVFDYNLGDFAAGGPDGSPECRRSCPIDPSRALIVLTYGMRGLRRWTSALTRTAAARCAGS